MSNGAQLDCVVIGYNELPFDRYETLLRQYGEESEAYRDLKFSFINFGGKKLNYVGLLNHVLELAGHGTNMRPFESGDIPNLAAVYLCNFLRKRGHHSKYINLFQYEKEQLKKLSRRRSLLRCHHHDILRGEFSRQRNGGVHQEPQSDGEDHRRRTIDCQSRQKLSRATTEICAR